jgi:tetraacyldisaccharide 4'-kinase
MLRRRGIPVVSAPDRSAGIRAAHAAGARLVLVDGGLGDTGLPRDSAIVCVDAHWPQGRGAIPVGTRRLPWSTIATAQAVWVRNASGEHLLPPVPPQTPLIRVTEAPMGWIHRGQTYPLDAITGPVHVAVGIAHPERFVCALLSLGLEIASLRCVRDHGHLTDLKPGTVVTEKDAARLPIDADIWALRLASTPSEGAALCTAIEEKCE